MKVTLTFNEQRRAAYRQQGLWGDASLADYWQQTARAMPDKIAVVDNHGASYTYSALDHAASCLANWMLAKGIESGDRIAFQLPGWCEFTVIYLACLKIGAVSVPLLPSWREAELVWVLNKCQAKMFFAPTCKRTARAVLTGMCYSAGSAMRHGSSSLTRLTGQSAMTPSTWRR
ncbi:short chain acyl-CoA synthetase [Escherichia coli]|nr:short chain acyl-CoA synthetase [Escherichia coli]